jgi:hypothetical protein
MKPGDVLWKGMQYTTIAEGFMRKFLNYFPENREEWRNFILSGGLCC